MAIAKPQFQRPAQGADYQVEIAVTVHVGERGGQGRKPVEVKAARGGDVREMKVAVVVIERGRAFNGCEKQVRQSVTVDIANRNASADEEVAVR